MARHTLALQRPTDIMVVCIYSRIVKTTIHKIGDFVVKTQRFLLQPSCIGGHASL